MKVFIVEEGEFCEGAVVRGVFSTYEKALKYVETHYPSDRWHIERTNEEREQPYRWEYGCDYVEIGEYGVE